MTLLQMRYFQAVCLYDSVSVAAQKLHVSQPTISTAIRNLEDEFHIVLFDKAGKKLRLTEAGAVFRDLCDRVLAQAEDARTTMLRMSGENQQIRLGADPALAAIILPSLYQTFSLEYPQNLLYVEEHERPLLLEKLERRQLDMILIPDLPTAPEHCSRLDLGRWEYALCVSRQHPLAGQNSVTAAEVGRLNLIAFPLESPPHSLPHAFCSRCGREPNIVYRSSQLSTIRRMIISNRIAHFTYRVLAESWHNTHVCTLEPSLFQSVSLYWHTDAYLSAGARDLIHCLKQLRDTDGFRIDL